MFTLTEILKVLSTPDLERLLVLMEQNPRPDDATDLVVQALAAYAAVTSSRFVRMSVERASEGDTREYP